MAYATLQELFSLALAAPAFVAYARPFDAVDATTATIRIKGHGLATGDSVTFEVSDGGFLPTGITQFQSYPVTVISPDLFRVDTPTPTCYYGSGATGRTNLVGLTAHTAPLSFLISPSNEKVYVAIPASLGTATVRLDGFEVDTLAPVAVVSGGVSYNLIETTNALTGTDMDFAVITENQPTAWLDAGDGWAITVDTTARLQAILEERSGFIDEHLTAHDVPLDPDPITGKYPWVVIGLCARLAARQAIASLEVTDPQYKVPIDRLLASEEDDKKLLADWKKGKPIQPRPTDDTPDTAENAARARSSRDEMPWSTGSFT